MSEYDLKRSEKIGQLYPILVDAKGNIIDGFHRLEADPNWRRERIKEIDTEEKLLVARCVSNWHRRQVSREEKEEWLNGLARVYQKQGLEVRHQVGSQRINQIIEKIVRATGLDETTVRDYISPEFKQVEARTLTQEPRVPAAHVIEKAFSTTKNPNYGVKLVQRHREEVKQELLKSPEFIREAIEKAPELVPTLPQKTIERAKQIVEPKEMGVKEGIVYTIGEYECPHCKKHYQIKCDGKRDWLE